MKCPFCETEVTKFHPNSDVVPRWLYRQSFEGNKNYKSYRVDFQKNKIEIKQSGFRDSFICWICEGEFSKNEGYARLVFGEKTNNHESVPNIVDSKSGTVKTQFGMQEGFGLFGLNFRLIQKFVLGVVLKGHLAKTGETSDLLGHKHFSKMRGIFFDNSQEDDVTYPIFVSRLNERNPLWNMVVQPTRSKTKEGLNIISFKGGGYEFNVNVQNHPLPNGGMNLRFTKDGNLLVLRSINNPKAIRRILSGARKILGEKLESKKNDSF